MRWISGKNEIPAHASAIGNYASYSISVPASPGVPPTSSSNLMSLSLSSVAALMCCS